MNLYRLSRFSIVACLTGILLLLVLSVDSGRRVLDKQEAIAEILELRERINDLSAASDSLVLFGADPTLWEAYRAEAIALRRELEQLGEQHPDARKASRRVSQLVQSVDSALGADDLDGDPSRLGPDIEPLDVPTRSRIVMHHVAGQGIALDTALDSALRQRQQAIAREATWIGATLAGAALLFGVLCVIAFGLIHGRVARPVRSLAGTLERLRRGETDARAPVTSDDELGRLAETLNRTLDERDAAETELTRQGNLLDMAGRAARFGAWSVDLETNVVEWSDVVAEIHGMPQDYAPSVEEGIRFFAPEYRGRIREAFTACVERGQPYDKEMEIIDANGQRRWVRTVGEPVYDEEQEIIRVQGAFQDISERKTLEQESRRLSDRLAAMLEAITDSFVAIDEQWRYTYVNATAAWILGKSREELIGTSIWDQFPELVGSRMERALVTAMEERISNSADEFFEPLETWFDMHAYPWEEGVAVFFRDVTEDHRMIEQLRAQEAALKVSRDELDAALTIRQTLINSLPAHIAMLDADGVIIDVNDQWRHFGQENLFNNGSDYGVGTNYITLCEAADGECSEEAKTVADGLKKVLRGKRKTFALEYPCHSPDKERWFRVMFSRLSTEGGEAGGAVAMHIDITERKRAERELSRLAYEDALTGLLSRNGFMRELRGRFERHEWSAGSIVAMLNVVGQHDINDAHGYEAGDRVLVELGRRLQHQAGKRGLAGRTGGDDFVVYLPSEPGQSVEEQLDRITAAVDQPVRPEEAGLEIEIDFRIGYTKLGDQSRSPEDLVREAELALFENRRVTLGQTPTSLAFTKELNRQARERIQLADQLRHALEAEEFELHFQPKVNLSNGRMIAAEALIRWQHPERGLLPPGLFIPVAEQSQLIGPIGDWVLRAACRQLREWQNAGLTTVRVAVNVSQIQFMIGDFPAKVSAALEEFDVDPSHLSLEITESVFERQSDRLLAELGELHKMGVRLALDDFGTGYSSLLYLQRYPFDEIKIDRGFVNRLFDDRYSQDIVRAIMNLAWALDAEAVAEGIESREVAEALLEMGCYEGQGYYYSMPLATEDFRWLLEKRSNLPLSPDGQSD